MFEKAIVAYIDVLGYEDIVKLAITRPEVVKNVEDVFYGLSVNAVKKLREIRLDDTTNGSDAKIQDYLKRVVATIRVRCIADSFIFTLPVSTINEKTMTLENCIETYFSVMTYFATVFISKMGYLLRGGISIGNHYENEEKENQLFVFSEAHNMAVTLEKQAEYPRIILDEPLQKYLTEISYSHIDKFFYKDEDGYYCLNIYSALRNWGNNENEVVADIKKGITLNLESNFNNAKKLKKLLYFIKYHNKRVISPEIDLPNQVFDISKYEKQLGHLLTKERET